MKTDTTELATGARLAHGSRMNTIIQVRIPDWVAAALEAEATVEQSRNTAALTVLIEALSGKGYGPGEVKT